MKTLITVAALALGLAAPAIAQTTVTPPMAPAAKPADATKAQPAVGNDAAKPVTKASDVKATDTKDAKKVDPKAAAPVATQPAATPKVDGTAKTTEKPAETKKQ
jgi:hypothetical protein